MHKNPGNWKWGDRAENSIMQTISIAVSAILIAAGLITAPSLINNARDTNAKQDLANVAMAQEYALSDSGTYGSSLGSLSTPTSTGGVKLTTSRAASNFNLIAGSDSGKPCYAAFVKSSSGAVYYRTSESSATQKVAIVWPASAPANYPFPCASWPLTAESATENLAPPLSDWTLINGATYDTAAQVVTLPLATSIAQSPLIKVDGPLTFTYSMDGMIPQNIDSAHDNVLLGSAYYAADGVTPVANSGGWTTNGQIFTVPDTNIWKRKASSLGSGITAPTPDIIYMRLTIWTRLDVSQLGTKFRFPTLTITR